MAVPVFLLGLIVNVLVCVPFLLDPFGWLEPGAAAAPDAADYVVFLDDGGHPDWEPFLAAHPQVEVVHAGERFGTRTVRISRAVPDTVAALRAQPFATMVVRGGAVVCQ